MSKVVKACVVNNLCNEMILSTLFLWKNQIIIDMENQAVTLKDSGCDLMSVEKTEAVCVLQLIHSILEPALFTVTVVQEHIKTLAGLERFEALDTELKQQYQDCFPEIILLVTELPEGVTHHIQLKDLSKVVAVQSYTCLQKYYKAQYILFDQHTQAGWLQRLESLYVSPVFLILKADPTDLLQIVCDYQALNSNTICNCTLLPYIDKIMNDAIKRHIYVKIDMTNTFFQTHMNSEHILLTVISTLFELYKWTVILIGLYNTLAM